MCPKFPGRKIDWTGLLYSMESRGKLTQLCWSPSCITKRGISVILLSSEEIHTKQVPIHFVPQSMRGQWITSICVMAFGMWEGTLKSKALIHITQWKSKVCGGWKSEILSKHQGKPRGKMGLNFHFGRKNWPNNLKVIELYFR